MKLPFIVFAAMTLLCGCFTSEQPFYEESDVVTDDRLIGTFDEGHRLHWIVSKSGPTHYDVTLASEHPDGGGCSMTFVGTLFQIGTNRFFDMIPVVESCPPGHHDAVSIFDMLQIATIQPMHLVMRIVVGTNDIIVSLGEPRKEMEAVAEEKALEFVASPQPLWRDGAEPRQVGLRMVPDTKRLREFLLRCGGDTNMFSVRPMKRLASGK